MSLSPVVCNASPLIALHQIGLFEVLRRLFGSLIVPSAVAAEVAPSVALPEWVEERPLTQTMPPLLLTTSLGRGEREAISLAMELRARLLVLDDRPARRVAQALRLPVIGTLGVLLAAKRQNLLSAVRPCLDGLAACEFRMTPSLFARVLKEAGEAP